MSQRKKTAPSTLKHPRSSPSSRKGLIATEKTKKQSVRKRTVLANRFHRTDRPLSCAAPPRAYDMSRANFKAAGASAPGRRTVPRQLQRETVSKLMAHGLPVHQTAPARKEI